MTESGGPEGGSGNGEETGSVGGSGNGPEPVSASDSGSGPVPVRDLMKQMVSRPEAEGEPRWEGTEHAFELDGERWVAAAAGAGAYGTGARGRARLVAVHFFREADLETPVREALVPKGRFPHLRPEELRVLLQDATPIELDRD